jgi:hypothetical protein
MLDFVRTTFENADVSPAVGGGQKRSAPGVASSAAPAKRPALGLGAPPAAQKQPRTLAEILEEVKSMPGQADKPVRQSTTPATNFH